MGGRGKGGFFGEKERGDLLDRVAWMESRFAVIMICIYSLERGISISYGFENPPSSAPPYPQEYTRIPFFQSPSGISYPPPLRASYFPSNPDKEPEFLEGPSGELGTHTRAFTERVFIRSFQKGFLPVWEVQDAWGGWMGHGQQRVERSKFWGKKGTEFI